MRAAAAAIRSARRSAGVTQLELSRRLGMSQPAIARLESPASNPTLETVERVLDAMDHRLVLAAEARRHDFDETMIAANLRLTPAERLSAFSGSYRNLRIFVHKARRSRGDVA